MSVVHGWGPFQETFGTIPYDAGSDTLCGLPLRRGRLSGFREETAVVRKRKDDLLLPGDARTLGI